MTVKTFHSNVCKSRGKPHFPNYRIAEDTNSPKLQFQLDTKLYAKQFA